MKNDGILKALHNGRAPGGSFVNVERSDLQLDGLCCANQTK